MRYHNLPKIKLNQMRRRFIDGELRRSSAKEIGVAVCTIWKYQIYFERLRQEYPDRLRDMDFYMPNEQRPHRPTPQYTELIAIMPQLLASAKAGVKAKPTWYKFKKLRPDGYAYDDFKRIFYQWVATHPELKTANLLPPLPEADRRLITKWRHGNDHRKWQIGVTLLMAATEVNVTVIMAKTEATRKSINAWLGAYRLKGIKGFELAPKKTPDAVVKRMTSRKDNLFKLLQEAPKLYGHNRTSWSVTLLHEVYSGLYTDGLSYMQTRYCLKQMGYSYRKSRDMLTSPDPKYREKIQRIQNILQKLKPDEKFFSIDEYGPVGIRIRGGRTLRHKSEGPAEVPQKQKCRGSVICTAAIELSRNQVTHFYSTRKNTFETIKLIDLLVEKYQDQRRLYLSWDNVSWHRSRILLDHIAEQNLKGKPEILLAPLPSCTQFLNVIESVFSGLAKSVIHNSNYVSMDECKGAIDLYFAERNAHFIANPKRAGNKIWGKEQVVPAFKDTHHCRNVRAMRGST